MTDADAAAPTAPADDAPARHREELARAVQLAETLRAELAARDKELQALGAAHAEARARWNQERKALLTALGDYHELCHTQAKTAGWISARDAVQASLRAAAREERGAEKKP